MHVAFATSRTHGELTPDDRLAASACDARGMRVSPAVWDDPGVRWSGFDAVIIRSTWDYHRRFSEFDAWLTRLDDTGVAVWNPTRLLRWNANKRYLDALAERGFATVPTAWVARGDESSLASVMDRHGWEDVVVKPTLSATAYGTHRVRRADADGVGGRLRNGPVAELMVQPFMPEVQTVGEWSLMFFRGCFSHSVRKRPARGDFRVQSDFGGSSTAEVASDIVIDEGAAILTAVEGRWLYARVDGIETASGFVLMELEMLEPMLFFDQDRAAAPRFAAALEEAIRHPQAAVHPRAE